MNTTRRLDDKLNVLLIAAAIVGVFATGIGNLEGMAFGRAGTQAASFAKAAPQAAERPVLMASARR